MSMPYFSTSRVYLKNCQYVGFKTKGCVCIPSVVLHGACDYPAEAMDLGHFLDALGAVTSDEFLTTTKRPPRHAQSPNRASRLSATRSRNKYQAFPRTVAICLMGSSSSPSAAYHSGMTKLAAGRLLYISKFMSAYVQPRRRNTSSTNGVPVKTARLRVDPLTEETPRAPEPPGRQSCHNRKRGCPRQAREIIGTFKRMGLDGNTEGVIDKRLLVGE